MIRVWLGAVGVIAAASGCVQAREVTTPSGKTGQLVQCDDTSDCYEKAREVCQGDYQIIDSASRSMGRYGSRKEITVECGPAPAPVVASPDGSERSASVAPAAELDEASAPASAAGFNFGEDVQQSSALCTTAGHEWKGGGARFRCTGTPVNTGLDAQARLAFCKGSLCRIDVTSPPPADPAALATRLEKVLAALTERYGKPTKREVVFPQSCSGAALVECLERNQASFLYRWSWKGRKGITLTLGNRNQGEPFVATKRDAAEQAAIKTLRIRYDEGRTPDPAKAASGDAAADSEHEVSGL